MGNPILRLKIRQMHLRLIGDASANRKVPASLAQVKCLLIADLLRIVMALSAACVVGSQVIQPSVG
jgi:hypothetical protein